MPRKLVVLTYDIRPDADPEEYAKDTREVDYPTFRQRPSVLEYSNFVIVKNHVGKQSFTRFDLMFVDEFENFERDVLGDPKVKAHADRWLEKWSVHGPEAGHTDGRNYQVAFAEEIAG
jgi:hypothetical protein